MKHKRGEEVTATVPQGTRRVIFINWTSEPLLRQHLLSCWAGFQMTDSLPWVLSRPVLSSPEKTTLDMFSLILRRHAFPHISTCTLPLPSRTHEVTPGATAQSQRHVVTPLCLRRGLRGHTATCQAHNNITSSHNSFMERSFVTLTPTVQMRTLGIKEDK